MSDRFNVVVNAEIGWQKGKSGNPSGVLVDSIAAELRIALDQLDVLSTDSKANTTIARVAAAGIRERLLANGVLGFK